MVVVLFEPILMMRSSLFQANFRFYIYDSLAEPNSGNTSKSVLPIDRKQTPSTVFSNPHLSITQCAIDRDESEVVPLLRRDQNEMSSSTRDSERVTSYDVAFCHDLRTAPGKHNSPFRFEK